MKEYRIEIGEMIFLKHKVIVEVPEQICAFDIYKYIENECQNKSEISEYIEKIGGKQLNFIEGDSGDSDLTVESCKRIKKGGKKNGK
ncbi:TPA: hypothetical protein SHW33_003766 [Clostridioides difficile]|uniref:Uncharacterized protein n=1 Tax=Clostridioides difficile TaxID=1496 RepID=A0A9X8WQI5_CLODI|nr:hypothetical protein [Clostridioides difficile]EGT4828268.1 hypothetical protein [Clostridioides difficile]EGT4856671.1 hypothetical protein [Clostridioides difficile]EGT4931020.1 hypothetical protein [Clostridioides difficile]EGT5284711.1 hypothetical protein [Clostridioides difficile]EIS9525774.1 hypothetical protein [Clostridioides difficile]